MQQGLEAAAAGRGGAIVLEGPAGIGKTTMLDAAVEMAGRRGFRTFVGLAGQLEQELPWNLVRQLFAPFVAARQGQPEPLPGGAAALAAPALGVGDGDGAGALHGLYWLVCELAQAQPLLLGIDDGQWGDDPSLRFLAYIAERIRDLPVLIVATARPDEEAPAPLRVLASRSATDVVVLEHLSSSATAEITREVLGADAEESFCAACHHATGGNPFLLRELLDQLRRDHVSPAADHAAEVAAITPASVTRSVLVRLSRLSAQARALASAVAVLGEATLRDGAELAGLPAAEAHSPADALAQAGILRPGAPLAFAHPVVREVIYREIPALRRARMHRDAARLLAGRDQRSRAAAHLLNCEPEGDQWAVALLREMATGSLAEGAPATAADLLARAAAEPPAEEDRAGVLLALGRAEAVAGRPGASERLREALEVTREPRDRAGILLDQGRLLYLAGRPGPAAKAFEAGLAALDGDSRTDTSLIAQLQAGWLTAARLELPLRARAAEMSYAIAADPPRGDNYGERALLAHVAGQLTFDAEPRERTLELARRAVGGGQLIADETADGMAWIAAMGALGWSDDFDGFESLAQDAIDDARRRGSVYGFATGVYGLSFSHYYRGMLLDAVADAEQCIAAERDGWRHFLTAALGQLAWALIERDELDRAAAQLRRAEADPTLAATSAHALVLEARARLELTRGQPQAALATALEAGRVTDEAGIPNPSIFPWRSRAALAAGALGRREQAEELLDEELRLARRFGAPRPIAVALIAAGTVRGLHGLDALEEAVALAAASPARLEHARALVTLGAALRRSGRITAARERLRAGLELAAALGALRLQQRAHAELLAAGVKPRRRRLDGAEELTAAERRVAEAAAGGMTNREIAEAFFISLRTVETHLTHAYQKLGIQTRSQLSGALSAVDADAS